MLLPRWFARCRRWTLWMDRIGSMLGGGRSALAGITALLGWFITFHRWWWYDRVVFWLAIFRRRSFGFYRFIRRIWAVVGFIRVVVGARMMVGTGSGRLGLRRQTIRFGGWCARLRRGRHGGDAGRLWFTFGGSGGWWCRGVIGYYAIIILCVFWTMFCCSVRFIAATAATLWYSRACIRRRRFRYGGTWASMWLCRSSPWLWFRRRTARAVVWLLSYYCWRQFLRLRWRNALGGRWLRFRWRTAAVG